MSSGDKYLARNHVPDGDENSTRRPRRSYSSILNVYSELPARPLRAAADSSNEPAAVQTGKITYRASRGVHPPPLAKLEIRLSTQINMTALSSATTFGSNIKTRETDATGMTSLPVLPPAVRRRLRSLARR
ncbi:hypothetical protein Bbelb_024570 [Branchiostoma belcheri]|nr:hypothetical protein Bbelb_024570 [Branchiostoma belcheri]